MQIFIGIIIMAAILGLAGLFLEEKIYQHSIDELLSNINTATYYFKSNPSTTCKIVSIDTTGKETNIKLMVTYNDGSTGEMNENLADFKTFWIEL